MPKYFGMTYVEFRNLLWVVFLILLGLSYFWIGFLWMGVAVLIAKAWVGPSLLDSIGELLESRSDRRDNRLIDRIEARIRNLLDK